MTCSSPPTPAPAAASASFIPTTAAVRAEFEGNPVVKHYGRDPRLLWHAPGKHWVMAVYDELTGAAEISPYTSPDLKTWTFQSRIEGFFECPDLFELPGRSRQVGADSRQQRIHGGDVRRRDSLSRKRRS